MLSVLSVPSVALVLSVLSVAPSAAQPPPPLPVTESGTQYLVFFRSQPIGREEVLVLRVADGWVVRGTSRLGPPIDITTRVAEVDYDLQWRPKSLLIDGIVRGQDVTLKTRFDGKQALSVLAVQGAPQSKVDEVSADPVVLPNTFLGSYAALARRLQGKIAGSDLRGYIAPQAEIAIHVMSAAPERIETPKGVINATRYALTFNNPPPAGDLAVNLWADAEGGLLRMNIPAQMIELAREDIASAASRTAAFSIPGDERSDPEHRLQSRGDHHPARTRRQRRRCSDRRFRLTDRDETLPGFGLRAPRPRSRGRRLRGRALRQARGVGQSGGRANPATIADYAEDARRALLWLEKQKGIDKDRIALVGHSEGRLVAMLTAGRERGKVAAMVLLATPSANGNDIVLEQQKHMLSKMPIDDAQRQEKIALQEKINQAVIKGTGWTDIPEAARRVADTPWFYSFLTFNPERAMDDTRQPVLIVQGELDVQVMPDHADHLAQMARERKGAKVPVEVVKVPGVNHLLVPAKTGEVTEYQSLGPDAKVSPQVTGAIVTFLTKVVKG
jgi:pimeloyl-ACP methyl ester carboxylesterase